ncbi:uncharacterized protein N7496_011228 [Penicillium cataractarum]|uniref:Alpha/beta hydrolase domain-containing protein n=1 Tax=Penicillium cataractarum TaxID=2100454 RepID=A0A9W9RFX5_9EURO|nr:uncharacterized protein N7496_011228 [Penicillium cataractarum]KAJ5358815.1 hypothetical protein N7496_011228 [Penicillium cataractarum]
MTIETLLPVFLISKPEITYLPETETSKPVLLEPYHVDLLPEYSYVSEEFLISGIAHGEPYCTRLLLRRPVDISKFSGFVVEEPSHLWGGTSIWRHINRWLMRNGHAWLEVDSQAPSAIGKIKNVDPERYKQICFIPGPTSDEFAENIPFVTDVSKEALSRNYDNFKAKWWPATLQSPDILGAASYALRFITHSSHLRLPDGSHPFEGYIPCQSGGTALPDCAPAKIIELLGESEFPSVRLPCGVSGQMKETTHRRPDSDFFRLYEIAGMAHRESRYPSELDLKRYSMVDLKGAEWSTFSNSFIYHAVLESMLKWISEDKAPAASAFIQTVGNTDEIVRDTHGNAIGGVRTLHTDVPLARFVAATPKGRPNWYWGSEWPFSDDELHALYGSPAEYRLQAGAALAKQIESGFLLAADSDVLRRETVEKVNF